MNERGRDEGRTRRATSRVNVPRITSASRRCRVESVRQRGNRLKSAREKKGTKEGKSRRKRRTSDRSKRIEIPRSKSVEGERDFDEEDADPGEQKIRSA